MSSLLGNVEELQGILEAQYKEHLRYYIEEWELGNIFNLKITYDPELYLFNIKLSSRWISTEEQITQEMVKYNPEFIKGYVFQMLTSLKMAALRYLSK